MLMGSMMTAAFMHVARISAESFSCAVTPLLRSGLVEVGLGLGVDAAQRIQAMSKFNAMRSF
jgi:hypothetical protein